MTSLIVPSSSERFRPSITGLLAQTLGPENVPGSLQPTTNDALGYFCPIPAPVSVSTIWVNVATAGITLTAGQNLLALCDASGNILSTTADQSANWLGAGPFGVALPGGPFLLSTLGCWLQLLTVGTTTPVFSGGAPASPTNLGPATSLRAQRVASGAISLGSFNPATSVTKRNMILIGLS